MWILGLKRFNEYNLHIIIKSSKATTMTTAAVKTTLKKFNLRFFKLYCVYLDPFNLSNVGYFSWS